MRCLVQDVTDIAFFAEAVPTALKAMTAAIQFIRDKSFKTLALSSLSTEILLTYVKYANRTMNFGDKKSAFKKDF